MARLKKFILKLLSELGIGVTSSKELSRLQSINESQYQQDIEFFANIAPRYATVLLKHLPNSKAQLRQDLFVLSHLNLKKNGYFVEFGATDGINLSNSYLLEMKFGWSGILAEPSKSYYPTLKKNRPKSHVDNLCVWKSSGEKLQFNETKMPELSTLEIADSVDEHSAARKNGISYEVTTISLLDLLDKYKAPKHIDYLSIDTEGSEYQILSAFNFSKYTFSIITCEHNFTPARGKIHALLESNGYMRVLPEISRFDDWYIRVPDQLIIKS